jgi:hypothetical protein
MSSSIHGLDKRLQKVLTRPEFLEMRGVAKEVPIFIQTYSPADEDQLRVEVIGAEQNLRKQGLRVKLVDLFELVLQLLDAKAYLEVIRQEEASWSKSDLFDTLQNVAEPSSDGRWRQPRPPPLRIRSPHTSLLGSPVQAVH